MTRDDKIFRTLQRHLDKQAIGFPATLSGADIRLLKRLFTQEEAKVALSLSYKPAHFEQILERTLKEFPAEQTERLLESMFQKGAIARKEKNGASYWYLMPFVIGMYEAQDGEPAPEFLADAFAYTKTAAFGKSFLAVEPSQMRTIPINKSLSAEHTVAIYDDIRSLVLGAPGSFAVLKCICRESHAVQGKPCKKTVRKETCLAFNDMAAMSCIGTTAGRYPVKRCSGYSKRMKKTGWFSSRQTQNSRSSFAPAAVAAAGCSPCKKCCPTPLSSGQAATRPMSQKTCTGCGKCRARCQVGAIELSGKAKEARVNLSRCIGWGGLCVPTCPAKAMQLRKKQSRTELPENEEEYLDLVMANKKKMLAQTGMLLKVLFRMRR